MPTHAGITISLQSQYDALTLPEHDVHITTVSPSLSALANHTPTHNEHPDKTFANHHHSPAATPIVTASVPAYPHSQFWLSYACAPPPLDDDGEEEAFAFYFFKLFVNGVCILSWGVGARDQWKGKTVFGLFDGGRDFEGARVVERRGLFFGAEAARGGFEVWVHRAKARRREGVKLVGVADVLGGGGEGGVDLKGIGRAERGERQRYYMYALLDAREEPMVRFRYRFESEGEIAQPSRQNEGLMSGRRHHDHRHDLCLRNYRPRQQPAQPGRVLRRCLRDTRAGRSARADDRTRGLIILARDSRAEYTSSHSA